MSISTIKKLACIASLSLMVMRHPLAWAEQSFFQRQDKDTDILLQYGWYDHQQQLQTLDFTVDKTLAYNQFRDFKNFQPHIAQRYVYLDLLRNLQKEMPKDARVDIQQRLDEIQISVKSRSREAAGKWRRHFQQKQQEIFAQYLHQNYYTNFNSVFGQGGVKPDHVRFARESLVTLEPLAKTFYDMLPQDLSGRRHTALILSWLQSIPYNELEDRLSSSGAGFSPPLQLMLNNQGDCDSKVTLMAGLMRLLLPRTSIVLIFIPNHALLGIQLSPKDDEEFITEGDTEYLLLETTGPQMLPLGKISDYSRQYVQGGMYKLEKLP